MKVIKLLAVSAFVASAALGSAGVMADGIVSMIVNSPLAAAGTVRDARVGINVYLQHSKAPGMEFMDPKVVGFGIPAGGYLDVEMGGAEDVLPGNVAQGLDPFT